MNAKPPTPDASGSKSWRARIADREQAIKDLEQSMSAPGFYENHEAAKPVVDRHQALMWEVGDLMSQWEALQHQTES